MPDGAWAHFPHSADAGVRGTGPTLAAAFEQAALALFAIVADPATIKPSTTLHISCDAPNDRLLLVDWLNALIYEASVRKMVFAHARAQITEGHLDGQVWGEAIDRSRHALAVEPKGATLTELKAERAGDGSWVAQCVVDV